MMSSTAHCSRTPPHPPPPNTRSFRPTTPLLLESHPVSPYQFRWEVVGGRRLGNGWRRRVGAFAGAPRAPPPRAHPAQPQVLPEPPGEHVCYARFDSKLLSQLLTLRLGITVMRSSLLAHHPPHAPPRKTSRVLLRDLLPTRCRRNNPIGPAGARALALAVSSLPALETLDLL
jgi:hypothetical protein